MSRPREDSFDQAETTVNVPIFNDALISLVIFHRKQSVPLLRLDFKKSMYNFDEKLLSGMISALIAVSEEIDKQHKSALKKVDQTSYDIIIELKKDVGIILFTLKEENDIILREFCDYIISEFEKRYEGNLSGKENFEQEMFEDFVPEIKKVAEAPVALSLDTILEIVPLMRKHAPKMNILICDKLLFTPIFKHLNDYMTPNEIQNIRHFLKNTLMTSSEFLGHMQKFGDFDNIVLKTKKRKIFIKNYDPFYCFIITRLETEDGKVYTFLEKLNEVILKNTIFLTTQQKLQLFQFMDFILEKIPELDKKELQDTIVLGMKSFQHENELLLKDVFNHYSLSERKRTFKHLLDYLITYTREKIRDVPGLGEKLESIREELTDIYEEWIIL